MVQGCMSTMQVVCGQSHCSSRFSDLRTPFSTATARFRQSCSSPHANSHARQRTFCSAQTGRLQTEGPAPALSDGTLPGQSGETGKLPPLPPPEPQGQSASQLKILSKRILRRLSSLPLAIAEMFVIAGLSAVGTVIEQNKPLQYYIDNYPDGPNKVLGFVTYDLIFKLQLDNIYTAPYFLGLMALLGASLAACTTTRQWPAVKVARRWRFAKNTKQVYAMGSPQVLPAARVGDLARILSSRGFQVFVSKTGALYGFKGLAGKLGPIGVHASMLAIMGGVAWGGLAGWKGTAMAPQGSDFLIADALRPSSPLAQLPGGGSVVAHVDKFDIDYRDDGSERQFSSDLSLSDAETGRLLSRQHISVNKPLRWEGVTGYQTDWAVSTLIVRAKGSQLQGADEAISLPMASLEGRPGVSGRLWGTFLPVEAPTSETDAPRGISILARDMQSVAIYDSKGEFVGIRRPDSGRPIQVEGIELVVEDMVGATGLELKSDPGVPYVYAGFAGLMITTVISYLSHSQVWALQEGPLLHVGSRTNRATVGFAREMSSILNAVPERPELLKQPSDPASTPAN